MIVVLPGPVVAGGMDNEIFANKDRWNRSRRYDATGSCTSPGPGVLHVATLPVLPFCHLAIAFRTTGDGDLAWHLKENATEKDER